MTADGDNAAPAAAPHIPVLLDRILYWLEPRDGDVFVDATFGAGGYTQALLAAADTRVIAIDRDRTAVAAGARLSERSGGRLIHAVSSAVSSTPLPS